MQSALFIPVVALRLAVASIVGQNLGAKQVERGEKAVHIVTAIGVALMISVGVFVFIFGRDIAEGMSNDAKTIEMTTNFLRISALWYPFGALDMTLSGALQGAGDTKTPMWASLVGNWIVRLPLAWFLSIGAGWGPNAVWWAMAFSAVVLSAIIAVSFHSGKWTTSNV